MGGILRHDYGNYDDEGNVRTVRGIMGFIGSSSTLSVTTLILCQIILKCII
jgi:hypothetical protein